MELHAGHHTVVQLLGLNVNIDTLMMTWIVAAIVIVVGDAGTCLGTERYAKRHGNDC